MNNLPGNKTNRKFKPPWSKLINVTTDKLPNLTGKNIGLMKRLQDKMKEENPDMDITFLAMHHPSGSLV